LSLASEIRFPVRGEGRGQRLGLHATETRFACRRFKSNISNDVSIIDVANLRIIKTIQVGELPWGIAISQQ
jgi:YVTN family beta-propeller protein